MWKDICLPSQSASSVGGRLLEVCGRAVGTPQPHGRSCPHGATWGPDRVTSPLEVAQSGPWQMKGLGGCTAVAGVSGVCGDGSAGHNSDGRQQKGTRVGSSRAGFRHCPCLLHSSQTDWQRWGRHGWAGRTPSLATPKVTGAEPTFVSFPDGYNMRLPVERRKR